MDSVPGAQPPSNQGPGGRNLHDLRNSLTTIQLLLEEVLDAPDLPEHLDEPLRVVFDETLRMIAVVTEPSPGGP